MVFLRDGWQLEGGALPSWARRGRGLECALEGRGRCVPGHAFPVVVDDSEERAGGERYAADYQKGYGEAVH